MSRVHFEKNDFQRNDENMDEEDVPQGSADYDLPREDDFEDPKGQKRTRSFVFTYYPKKPDGILRDTTCNGWHGILEMASSTFLYTNMSELKACPSAYSYYQAMQTMLDTAVNAPTSSKYTKTKLLALVMAPESCPTTKRPHLQCYARFEGPITYAALRKRLSMILPNPYKVMECRGTTKENIDYIVGPYKNAKGKTKPFNVYAVKYIHPDLDVNDEPVRGTSNARDLLAKDALETMVIHGLPVPRYTEKELIENHPSAAVLYLKNIMLMRKLKFAPDPTQYKHRMIKVFHPWQSALYSLLESEPILRRIIFVCGPPNIGKTAFLTHLQIEGSNLMRSSSIPPLDRFIHGYPSERPPSIIVFDLPLAVQEIKDEQLEMLETLSDQPIGLNGYFGLGGCITINAHILVFCNFPPPVHASTNRFVVLNLLDNRPKGIYDFMNPTETARSTFTPFEEDE